MWIHCIYEEIQTFIKPKMVMTTTDYYVYVFVVVTQCNKLRCVFDQCPHVGLQLFSHCTPTAPPTVVLHYLTVRGNNDKQRHLELPLLYVTERRMYLGFNFPCCYCAVIRTDLIC